MKKLGAIISLIILTVMLSGTFVFAGDLKLVETTPKEDSHSATVANMMIKLKFSEDMSDEKAQKANAKAFTLKDPKGKSISIKPLYDGKRYPNEVWLLVNDPLESNTKYTLTVDQNLQSSGGNTPGEAIVFHFSTRDTSQDGRVNMILMAVMFGGMIGFTVWDTRRKVKKEAEKTKTEEDNRVNPYKEAKKTGKSVEEIVAKTEKEKQKQKAKEAKRVSSVREKNESSEQQSPREGVKRVAGRRPISAAGAKSPASVVAKRQAKEAARKKEEARKKAAQKGDSQKSKGSKQQQKKKKH